MDGERIQAWHFLPASRVPQWNYVRPCYVGQTLTARGDLALCENGMHASRRALDALLYAPGPVVCRVELSGEIIEDDDKMCARRRTILAMADATDTLHAFERWCALQVIDLWDAPDVVREYLATGDEALRDAACRACASARAAASARACAWESAWESACARERAWVEYDARLEADLIHLLAGEEASDGIYKSKSKTVQGQCALP